MRKIAFTLFLLCVVAVITDAQPRFRRKAQKEQEKTQHIEAVYSTASPEILIIHKGFNVSYNEDLLIPNWVAYELTAEEASATIASRTDEFLPDPDLVSIKARQADSRDYSNSGYDRGHMAAAADMKWDLQAMVESFYMTNTVPQDRQLNGGLWLELEQKCRYWAKKYGRVWIVCGPVFFEDEFTTIGSNGVAVPDMLFKCVCMQIDGRWTMAAFAFPNTDCKGNLSSYIFPVIAIESTTGCEYFNNIPLPAQDLKKLKFNLQNNDWVIPGWKAK